MTNKLEQLFNGKIKVDSDIWKAFGEGLKDSIDGDKDDRYKIPKGEPKASDELVDRTIEETEIYRRAKELILNAQRKQVAYGLDKYPTPLNADVWDILETIDHILEESIDKIHYLVMLRIHLERIAEKQREDFKQVYSDHLDAIMADADIDSNTVKYYGNDITATEEIYKAVEESEKDESKTITININVDGTIDHHKLAKDITELIQKEGYIRGN